MDGWGIAVAVQTLRRVTATSLRCRDVSSPIMGLLRDGLSIAIGPRGKMERAD